MRYMMDDIVRKADFEDYIAREMHERRKQLVKESFSVVGQDLAEDFLTLIAAAQSWDMPEADIFINQLDLSDKDICCITDNRERYKNILEEEEADARIAQYV